MGKKSRLKREKRSKSAPGAPLTGKVRVDQDKHQLDFTRRVSQLRDFISKFNAEDVCGSLCASDLWLPNISSQVKHHFALGVFLSMDSSQFTQENRVNSYESFKNFIAQVHSFLPSFPMLEDYVPEPDWGEIKIYSQGEFLRVFYGNSVERITDFVEAFKLKFTPTKSSKIESSTPAPLSDLHAALMIQNYLASTIEKTVVGTAENIHPGHIEIPSEPFWSQCRLSLTQGAARLIDISCSQELVLSQGQYRMSNSLSDFGNSIFNGTSMPAILAKVGEVYFPVSPRNAIGVVLDHWENDAKSKAFTRDEHLAGNISTFLVQRFGESGLITGPCNLATRHQRFWHNFSAVILGQRKVYFVITQQAESADKLLQVEKDIYEILSGTSEWAILRSDSPGVYQLKISPDDVEVIALIAHTSPQFTSVSRHPDSKARILFLPDFITIFDSLNNIAELERFWSFVDTSDDMLMPMLGMSDLFASFRDSHSVLVDGAITPSMVLLDPHWGSNWRYKELAEFWSIAPKHFPDDTNIAWKMDSPGNGIQELIAKGSTTLAQYVPVNDCVIYFLFEADIRVLDVANGRMLELFIHCIADSLAQRKMLLSDLPLFKYRRVITKCAPNSSFLVSESEGACEANAVMPLFENWKHVSADNGADINVTVQVNLSRVQTRLTDQTDASFEVECLCDWLNGMCDVLGQPPDVDVISRIAATKILRPRFTVSRMNRVIDVPDYGSAEVPTQMHYKLARKGIAVLFQKIGAAPGRYELAEAKALIDPVRDEARRLLHERIAKYEKDSLLTFCIEQHDTLAASHTRESTRIRLSMVHDVDYDRSQKLANLHDSFIRDAKNYRYLLECCLSATTSGTETITANDAVGLIADIDWLFTLYGASDVLHNDIEVAGIDLDNSFVPDVFYSEHRDKQEKKFGLESANFKLGLGLESNDKVESLQESGHGWDELNSAMLQDAGFSLTHFSQALIVLSQWQSVRGEKELRFSYHASQQEIVETFLESIEDMEREAAQKIVEFATLDPKQVRRLIGKEVIESDVPIWEHNKRGNRYTIKPLIPTGGGLSWGAAMTKRAFDIWTSTISDGYLPADFPWPNVKKIVRDIKSGIEKQLEVRASDVCSRTTKYIMSGIDFKFRFPQDGFDDVGDYDVLAYWPETNQWLAVECKYNQPPFCLKDGRRLRERIFGIDTDHGQFSKIERRRNFLLLHAGRLRALLKWPPPEIENLTIHELYVSRDIYWWMRNPPYEVPTQFVRVDALDNWLRTNNLLATT